MAARNDINLRITVCEELIRILEQQCALDPRQSEALEHYRRQLDRLKEEQRTGNPPNIVIGLRPGELSAKTE